MTTCWALLMLAVLGQNEPAVPEVRGDRVSLSVGKLFVPEGFAAPEGRVSLLIHFHGAPAVVERCVQKVQPQAILVNVTLNGLSGVYRDQFAKPERFAQLLDETSQELHRRGVVDLKWERITVSSFSAGFGAVRELLKSEEHFQRISSLVMADSIYCGFRGEAARREVDPDSMAGFTRFAREAAAGRKTMIVSFCQLKPETYASTGETAEFLLRQVNRFDKPTLVDRDWDPGWRCLSRWDERGLHVVGFAGQTGQDHMQHLRNLHRLMELAQPQ